MTDKDIKEVAHFRKKLNGRRLDYDYKRGKLKSGSKGVTDDEVQASYEKLEESIQLGIKWLNIYREYKVIENKRQRISDDICISRTDSNGTWSVDL